MKIEKQKILLLLLFVGLAAMLVFVTVHDPYAEQSRNEIMNLILPFMGGLPFFN